MDVVIVGAGVGGLVCSIELSKSGANVIVLEEHETIGIPSHCAGIVSTDYHKKIGIPYKSDLDLNVLYGLRFTSGSENIDVRARRPIAKVISRKDLDLYLSGIATDSGSRIIMSNKAVRIEQNSKQVIVTDERGERHEADYAVIADGIAGRVNRMIWPNKTTGNVFPSAQCIAKVKTDPSLATVLLSNEISPDFFAYLAPIDAHYARIGVASRKRDVVESLKLAAKKMGAELASKPRLWGIWIGSSIKERRVGRVFGVGDAAGMVKATSGGGIVFSGLSARLASMEITKEWKEEHDEMGVSLERELYSQTSRMFLIRRLINSIGQDLFFEAIKYGTHLGKVSEFAENVDFDFHGDLWKMFKAVKISPFWLSFGLRAIKELLTA